MQSCSTSTSPLLVPTHSVGEVEPLLSKHNLFIVKSNQIPSPDLRALLNFAKSRWTTRQHNDFKSRCNLWTPTYECGGEVEAAHQTAVLRDDPALRKTGVRNLVLRDQGSGLRELETLLLVRASSVASSGEQRYSH